MHKGNEPGESPVLWTVAGILIVALIGAFDRVSNPEFAFTLFYLVPLFLTAGRAGRIGGALVAGASAVAYYVGQLPPYPPVTLMLAHVWNTLTTLTVFMVVHELFYSCHHARAEQETRDWRDSVTGAGNMKFLFEVVGHELSRAKRFGRPFSIVYADVDRLRAVNQKMGRRGGDTLLGLVARTTKRTLRQSDVVTRIGGDEFAILLPETDHPGSQIVAERLSRVLIEIFEHDGWPASLTLGVATFASPPETVDAAVKEAEQAMYTAKQKEGERVEHVDYPGKAVAK